MRRAIAPREIHAAAMRIFALLAINDESINGLLPIGFDGRISRIAGINRGLSLVAALRGQRGS